MADVTRRTALTGGALGVGFAALAACSAGKHTGTAASGPSTNAGGAGSSGNAPAAEGAATGGSAGGTEVIKLSDVPVGGSASAKLDGKPVVVSQQSAGKVAAFSAICTHQGCTVNPAGKQFHCPCHGSVYDAFTGAVINGPAPQPLHPIAVTVTADAVSVT